MSDKVIGGRGHKISPVGKGTSKIAYSPLSKIDQDIPDNCMSMGVLSTPNGNYEYCFKTLISSFGRKTVMWSGKSQQFFEAEKYFIQKFESFN